MANFGRMGFLGQIFQKVPRNAMACFFKTLPASQKFLPIQGLFSALDELSFWSTQKNSRHNFRPLEEILDPPLAIKELLIFQNFEETQKKLCSEQRRI